MKQLDKSDIEKLIAYTYNDNNTIDNEILISYFDSKVLKGRDAILFEKKRRKMKYGKSEKKRILSAFKSLSVT